MHQSVRAKMTRAYSSVKGKKRKNKNVVEKYHREEKEDEEQVQPKKPNLQKEEPKPIITEENNNNELIGIPIAPPTAKNSEKPGVIFILERASLEVAKVGKMLMIMMMATIMMGMAAPSTPPDTLPIQNPFPNITYSPPPPHHTSPPPPPHHTSPPPSPSSSGSSKSDTIIIVVVIGLVAFVLIGVGMWYLYQYLEEKRRVKRVMAQIRDLPGVPMGPVRPRSSS